MLVNKPLEDKVKLPLVWVSSFSTALPCERPIPQKAKATIYHCQVYGGLIWVNLSE